VDYRHGSESGVFNFAYDNGN